MPTSAYLWQLNPVPRESRWIMRIICNWVSLALVTGVMLVGCKKAKSQAATDPHSPEVIMMRLQEQGKQLNDAFARNDFAYIHDYAYYFNGLIQALFLQLDDAQKQRMKGSLEELGGLANQLDHSAGRKHAEATEAGLKRLQVVLKELDKQFREGKQSG